MLERHRDINPNIMLRTRFCEGLDSVCQLTDREPPD